MDTNSQKFIIIFPGLIFTMIKSMKAKVDQKYDLEERIFVFAKNVIEYVKNLPKGISYSEIGKQLVRSAGSVGANYIEADESLSKKEFIMCVLK